MRKQYSQNHLFFKKSRGGFPVFSAFDFENLICLAIQKSPKALFHETKNKIYNSLYPYRPYAGCRAWIPELSFGKRGAEEAGH